VVRGMDNKLYYNDLDVYPAYGYSEWFNYPLSGATLFATTPTLAPYANGCSLSLKSNCNSIDALAARGTDNAVYHNTFSGAYASGWSGWDSPGGSISNSPALAYVPTGSGQFLLLVEGNPSSKLYSNTVTGSTWSGYSSVGGATNSDPALVAVL